MENLCLHCGRCCTDLQISISPFDLLVQYEKWYSGETEKIIKDIFLIYPMLIYKFYNEKIERYHYSCKHRDIIRDRCSIYDNRPFMCKTFPDGLISQYSGCGFNDAVIKEELVV